MVCCCAQGDAVAVKTAITFVDSLWEMLAPVALGADALLLPPSLQLSPASLASALAAHGATHLVAVPSVLRLLAPALAAPRRGGRLRLVVSSGEPLGWELARQLLACVPPGCAVLNLYGSTEVAADCSWFQLPHADAASLDTAAMGAAAAPQRGSVPAGRPIASTLICVARLAEEGGDERGAEGGGPAALRLCCRGEPGEVCVAGAGLAAGYLHDDARTAQRFPLVTAAAAGDDDDQASLQLAVVEAPSDHGGGNGGDGGGHAAEAAGPLARALFSAAGLRVFRTRDLGLIDAQGARAHRNPAAPFATLTCVFRQTAARGRAGACVRTRGMRAPQASW